MLSSLCPALLSTGRIAPRSGPGPGQTPGHSRGHPEARGSGSPAPWCVCPHNGSQGALREVSLE